MLGSPGMLKSLHLQVERVAWITNILHPLHLDMSDSKKSAEPAFVSDVFTTMDPLVHEFLGKTFPPLVALSPHAQILCNGVIDGLPPVGKEGFSDTHARS